ncbi:MAG: transcription factor S [Euryarchaeota archaeon]|nr:transcription factor S [Euryarchaeota archaeon]
MEFCPKCKSMMKPSAEGKVKCRNPSCGLEKGAGPAPAVAEPRMGVTSKRREREVTVVDGVPDTLPTTRAKCSECGHETAQWWLRQMRGADEPETRFLRCMKCGKTWREYA